MPVKIFKLSATSRGNTDILDITDDIQTCVCKAEFKNGTATVFVPGSTAGLTTVEFEPGVVKDLSDCMARIAPEDLSYAHERAWHDGNGHSHVRAALIGPSLVVPFENGELGLGTWQQVVLIDFDNKPRQRRFSVTVMGE